MIAYMFPKELFKMVGRKPSSGLTGEFREFADKNPNFFSPHKGYIGGAHSSYQYDPLCFLYFLENRELIKDEVRFLNFRKELPNLKVRYQNLMVGVGEGEEIIKELLKRVEALEQRKVVVRYE